MRATSRFRGLIRIFSILPIITPPFVVGLALILAGVLVVTVIDRRRA